MITTRECSPSSSEREETRCEGVSGFDTTTWSVVHAAASSDPERARTALLTLADRYREPIRAYVLRVGRSESEADVLTARFFGELGASQSLGSAAAGTGPFRIWLLDALRKFLRSNPPPDPSGSSTQQSPALPSSGAEPLPAIPGYEVHERLGAGRESGVYRAYDRRAQRVVALKVLHEAHRQSPEAVEHFRKSAALVSTLDHPNVAKVYDIADSSAEQPYYSMQLVVGGTLAAHRGRLDFHEPEGAARLMIKVARALHVAHQHGVLHRNLSPSSVLLDVHREPFLRAFAAPRVQQLGERSRAGKYAYVAPEVAAGERATVAADVYGLGAILYELWTGRAPENREELRRELGSGAGTSPPALPPEIPRDLASICTAALSVDPARRHPSAGTFAESLERVLDGLPPVWPNVTRRRRAWLWGRQHPLLALGGALSVALLLAANVLVLRSVRAQQADVEAQTLHANAALASAQAGAVLKLFQEFAGHAARAATDPDVRAVLLKGEVATMVPALRSMVEHASRFDNVSVFSPDGRMLARYPDPHRAQLNKEYRFRDYYECVHALVKRSESSQNRRNVPEVCLAPAIRGEFSRSILFTVAAPAYGDDGRFIGFVILNKHAKHTLEEIEIDDVYQSGQATALFGQRGRDRHSRDEDVERRTLTAVAHPGLFGAEERALPHELSRKLLDRFGERAVPGWQLEPVRVRPWEEPNYIDPVTGEQRLAAFAPVGKTGFIVAVSTPRARAFGASERHVQDLWRCAAVLGLGLVMGVFVALRASLRGLAPEKRS
jgi:serine/threonine-protein kinase